MCTRIYIYTYAHSHCFWHIRTVFGTSTLRADIIETCMSMTSDVYKSKETYMLCASMNLHAVREYDVRAYEKVIETGTREVCVYEK